MKSKKISVFFVLAMCILSTSLLFGNCQKIKLVDLSLNSKLGNNGEGYGGKPIIMDVKFRGEQDTTAEISGVNFGAGKPAPLLWDDFESGLNLDPISPAPLIGSWIPSAANVPFYSTRTSHSGGTSMLANSTAAGLQSHFNVALPDSRDFYVSFRFYYDYIPTPTGKMVLFNMFDDISSKPPEFITGATITGLGEQWQSNLNLDLSGITAISNYPILPVQDSWHHFEAIVRQSNANTSDGMVRLTINNQVVYSQIGIVTRETAGKGWKAASFFSEVSDFAGGAKAFIDDAYLSDTWARVEIGDAPTYSACTKREIQVSAVWAGNSIVIPKIHRGSFLSGDSVYVYVVNSDNTASDGFLIKLP